jgi:hypothetical protein
MLTHPAANMTPANREDIFKEIDILCGLNHENVVYLKEYFEEGNKVSSSGECSVAVSDMAWSKQHAVQANCNSMMLGEPAPETAHSSALNPAKGLIEPANGTMAEPKCCVWVVVCPCWPAMLC